jgi:hypothetical protein
MFQLLDEENTKTILLDEEHMIMNQLDEVDEDHDAPQVGVASLDDSRVDGIQLLLFGMK